MQIVCTPRAEKPLPHRLDTISQLPAFNKNSNTCKLFKQIMYIRAEPLPPSTFSWTCSRVSWNQILSKTSGLCWCGYYKLPCGAGGMEPMDLLHKSHCVARAPSAMLGIQWITFKSALKKVKIQKFLCVDAKWKDGQQRANPQLVFASVDTDVRGWNTSQKLLS